MSCLRQVDWAYVRHAFHDMPTLIGRIIEHDRRARVKALTHEIRVLRLFRRKRHVARVTLLKSQLAILKGVEADRPSWRRRALAVMSAVTGLGKNLTR